MTSLNRINLVFSVCIFAMALIVVFSWPKNLPPGADGSVAASVICADIAPDLSLAGKAAYAADLKTGKILYQKNADVQLPLASLTKLATIATASDILSPTDTITISEEALTPEGDAGLEAGESWNAQELIDFTLIVSANDGAHAIALAAAEKKNEPISAFIQAMNEKARAIGMTETFFSSDTGLDVSSTTASAYGSARDVATLLAYLVHTNPRMVEGTKTEAETFTSLSGITHDAENTSSVIGNLQGGIASKTGYTDLAGGNLAIEFEPILGRPVVAVILGSTREERDTDMLTLTEGAKKALRRMILCGNGD